MFTFDMTFVSPVPAVSFPKVMLLDVSTGRRS